MTAMKKLGFLYVTSLFVLGCSFPMEQVGLFKNGKVAVPEVGGFEADNTELSFQVLSERSLNSCAECHGFVKTPENFAKRKQKIIERIYGIGGELMPPPSKGYSELTECQKKMIETYFDDQASSRSAAKIKDIPACSNGAPTPEVKPEPTPAPTATPTPDVTPTPAPVPTPTPEPVVAVDFKTLELSFENLQKQILEPKCMKCHREATARATILETVTGMQMQELIGKTAEESPLYQVVIKGMNKRFMPPPQSGLAPLTADEADYLKRWIESVPPSEFDF